MDLHDVTGLDVGVSCQGVGLHVASGPRLDLHAGRSGHHTSLQALTVRMTVVDVNLDDSPDDQNACGSDANGDDLTQPRLEATGAVCLQRETSSRQSWNDSGSTLPGGFSPGSPMKKGIICGADRLPASIKRDGRHPKTQMSGATGRTFERCAVQPRFEKIEGSNEGFSETISAAPAGVEQTCVRRRFRLVSQGRRISDS